MTKSCAICGKPVAKGTGMYYKHRLIHKALCRGIAKFQRWRL